MPSTGTILGLGWANERFLWRLRGWDVGFLWMISDKAEGDACSSSSRLLVGFISITGTGRIGCGEFLDLNHYHRDRYLRIALSIESNLADK